MYQLSCQGHRWVAMLLVDKRWKHLSAKPYPRLNAALLEDYEVDRLQVEGAQALKPRSTNRALTNPSKNFRTLYQCFALEFSIINLQFSMHQFSRNFGDWYLEFVWKLKIRNWKFPMRSIGLSSNRAYGVYTGKVTPLPISNRTVKLARADGSPPPGGWE